MLFTSVAFLAFLAVVAALYHALPLPWRLAYLLVASVAFYCTWSVVFAGLLLAVAGVAYWLAIQIEATDDEERRWRLLLIGVVALFLPLLVFKYVGGFGAIATTYLGMNDAAQVLGALHLLTPIGLSYYTFKLVSYLTDVYWGRQAASRRFVEIATYATFFPQIISGPIQRANDFIGQIHRLAPTTTERFASGVRLLLFGFFKKMVVADRIGVLVDPVYVNPQSHSDVTIALATYLFFLQVYADFSGLTDIARGSARLLGLQSPKNFDQPLYGENIQEFWRRWHMTLTNWVREYVFIPLRMSLRNWGELGLAVSVIVNMLLVGLWHGPWTTFIVFGLVHGVYVYVSSQTFRRRRAYYDRVPALKMLHVVSGPLITFHMVYFTMPFFRAGSLPDAFSSVAKCARGVLELLGGTVSAQRAAQAWASIELKGSAEDALVLVLAIVAMEMVHALQARQRLASLGRQTPEPLRWLVYYAFGISILLWGEMGSRQFIYAGF